MVGNPASTAKVKPLTETSSNVSKRLITTTLTVTLSLVTPSRLAVTSVVPCSTPVSRPLGVMVAVAASSDSQATLLVTSAVELSL
ncbi:hypothetical protein D3C80_960050 [compost metagenome]